MRASDESTSDDASSSSSSSSTSTPETNKEEPEALTKDETKAVNRSKLLVYIALAVAAAAVGTATYFLLANEQTQTFKREFKSIANELDKQANLKAEDLLGQVTILSVALTSQSLTSSPPSSWPNVTLQHFDSRFQAMSAVTGLQFVMFAPLVENSTKVGYETYAGENQNWIDNDLKYRGWKPVTTSIPPTIYPYDPSVFPLEGIHGEGGHEENESLLNHTGNTGISDAIDGIIEGAGRFLDEEELVDGNVTDIFQGFIPVWQFAPVPRNRSIINLDLYTHLELGNIAIQAIEARTGLLSKLFSVDFLLEFAQEPTADDEQPRAVVVDPVYSDLFTDSAVTGFVYGAISWDRFFQDAITDSDRPIDVQVDEVGCENEKSFMYRVSTVAEFLGYGVEPNERFVNIEQEYEFAAFANPANLTDDPTATCVYKLRIRPTLQMEGSYKNDMPLVYTVVVVSVFVLTVSVFIFYDYMVQRRQNKLLSTAKRTNAIVSSLFPKDVQRRIMAEAEKKAEMESKQSRAGFNFAPKSQMKDFLDDENTDVEAMLKTKPIADLFPEATIMFADIVGFTAWSSMREPAQVFILLETIYHAYDEIAKKRRVFKVETVGDCYVAVAGLPEPRKDHATVMARFARDCLVKITVLVKELEVTLGPDTTELGMRFGLHSGPVTAGVLRGERARFQLFGDTVNTTSRIETTGKRDKIHISQDTADRLVKAGKAHWVIPREDKVTAKGKGELTTFWLKRADDKEETVTTANTSNGSQGVDEPSQGLANEDDGLDVDDDDTDKHKRLIDWNTEVLCRLLKEIQARRIVTSQREESSQGAIEALELSKVNTGTMVLDEVQEIITLPKFDGAAQKTKDVEEVNLPKEVVDQLREYVSTVAAMYRENPFHNYEHASHVTMSVVKLLSRIVAPEITCTDQEIASTLHDHTYGITSDPLTQFAVVLSALIHDADHPGVPNAALVKEGAHLAQVYKNKSVAEQNSVDLCWDLLMDPGFADLRRAIYFNAAEFKRFRQLVVNTVMATDIMDKDLGNLRKARWNKAFSESVEEEQSISTNRKATIVIEHLIQASDVAHTMQHWHIYRKWNARFFEECYQAYLDGRAAKDPSESWYQGEIGFFDFYIIPLAKKLKDCGVFGVSSDEYLNYAQQNRKEWEQNGREVVEEMIESMSNKKKSDGAVKLNGESNPTSA